MSTHHAGAKQALATVFLGDWHPVLRDLLDLFRLSFLAGAAVFAIQGDWDAVVRLALPLVAVFARHGLCSATAQQRAVRQRSA